MPILTVGDQFPEFALTPFKGRNGYSNSPTHSNHNPTCIVALGFRKNHTCNNTIS